MIPNLQIERQYLLHLIALLEEQIVATRNVWEGTRPKSLLPVGPRDVARLQWNQLLLTDIGFAERLVDRAKASIDKWDKGKSIPSIAMLAADLASRNESMRLVSQDAFREGFINLVARTIPRGIHNPIGIWVRDQHPDWLDAPEKELEAMLIKSGKLKNFDDSRRGAALAACRRLRKVLRAAREKERVRQENKRKLDWLKKHGPLTVESTDGGKTWKTVRGKPFSG